MLHAGALAIRGFGRSAGAADAHMRPPARADFLTRERGYMVNPQHMDLLLMLAGLGDVVGGLHPQERIHLHSKGFLNAERHIRRLRVTLRLQVPLRSPVGVCTFQAESERNSSGSCLSSRRPASCTCYVINSLAHLGYKKHKGRSSSYVHMHIICVYTYYAQELLWLVAPRK